MMEEMKKPLFCTSHFLRSFKHGEYRLLMKVGVIIWFSMLPDIIPNHQNILCRFYLGWSTFNLKLFLHWSFWHGNYVNSGKQEWTTARISNSDHLRCNLVTILPKALTFTVESSVRNDTVWLVQFITLWATFQSQWQQIFCPNRPHLGNFCRGVKIFHFPSEIIFWATFIDIWQLFTCQRDFKFIKIKTKEEMHWKVPIDETCSGALTSC